VLFDLLPYFQFMSKLPKQMSASIGMQKKINKTLEIGTSPKKRKARSGARTRTQLASE
jgi:hypothetical protein